MFGVPRRTTMAASSGTVRGGASDVHAPRLSSRSRSCCSRITLVVNAIAGSWILGNARHGAGARVTSHTNPLGISATRGPAPYRARHVRGHCGRQATVSASCSSCSGTRLQGASARRFDFVHAPADAGRRGRGGMANALRRHAQAAARRRVVGGAVGFLGGVYLAEYDGGAWRRGALCADVLNGIPSIVIGITVYGLLRRAVRPPPRSPEGSRSGCLMIPSRCAPRRNSSAWLPDTLPTRRRARRARSG